MNVSYESRVDIQVDRITEVFRINNRTIRCGRRLDTNAATGKWIPKLASNGEEFSSLFADCDILCRACVRSKVSMGCIDEVTSRTLVRAGRASELKRCALILWFVGKQQIVQLGLPFGRLKVWDRHVSKR